jgi:hypothetical protein
MTVGLAGEGRGAGMALRLRAIGTTRAVNTAVVLTVIAPAILAGPVYDSRAVVPMGSLQLVDNSTPSAPPHCDASQPRGQVAHYQGGSVSAVYDRVFHPWAGVPYLDTHVPQALATWTNWDGAGHTLVLLGMYRKGHHSFLVGVDPASGRALGTVEIEESHLGGMGFVGHWLFAQDNADARKHPTVRRYRVEALQAAMRSAVQGDHGDRHPFLRADGAPRPIDAIDFFAEEGNSVYAGHHGTARTAKMYRYTLTPAGQLKRVEGPWRIPWRAQGLVITPQAFVFASDTGVGRGRLSVVRRADPKHIGSPIACVWLPAMPEDMTVLNGTLVIDFESGTKRYAHDHPANRIRNFHEGVLSALLSLTHVGDAPPARVTAAAPTQKPAAQGPPSGAVQQLAPPAAPPPPAHGAPGGPAPAPQAPAPPAHQSSPDGPAAQEPSVHGPAPHGPASQAPARQAPASQAPAQRAPAAPGPQQIPKAEPSRTPRPQSPAHETSAPPPAAAPTEQPSVQPGRSEHPPDKTPTPEPRQPSRAPQSPTPPPRSTPNPPPAPPTKPRGPSEITT